MKAPAITLHVPFLAGTTGDRRPLSALLTPAPPALELWLQRADHRPRRTDADTVDHLFGLAGGAAAAPLSRYADAGTCPEGNWLRADPVVLNLGRRGLLMGPPVRSLEAGEIEDLERLLAPVFGDVGLHLELLANGRGYLRLPPADRTAFSRRPPVAGEDIAPLMPVGDGARFWRRLLNECQTRLHRPAFAGHDAPRTVNSLFLWGGGPLPISERRARWDTVWTDDPVFTGAARLAGLSSHPLPDTAEDWIDGLADGDRHLIHLPALEAPARVHAYEEWTGIVHRYEARWFAPLVESLWHKRCRSLELLTNGHGWRLERGHRRRFWRRRRLTELLFPA